MGPRAFSHPSSVCRAVKEPSRTLNLKFKVHTNLGLRTPTSPLCCPQPVLDHCPHLMPKKLWGSPGAQALLSLRRLSMWAREMTVVDTYQGSPRTDMSSSRTATQKRSRWKPAPFCRSKRCHEKAISPNHKSLWSGKKAGHLLAPAGIVVSGGDPTRPTCSWYSERLRMTAVICWSMKMRMDSSRAGSTATTLNHQGLAPKGDTSQLRPGSVGWERGPRKKVGEGLQECLTSIPRIWHYSVHHNPTQGGSICNFIGLKKLPCALKEWGRSQG